MSDFIANKENREEEHSGFNLAALWKIVVLHWYWIVLSTIVALGAAFGYLKYTRPVYASNMKILVKDEDSRSRMYRGGQLALESMGVISNSNGFDNELEILTSSNISQRVIKSLKLYVSYELDGRLRNHELYKNNPYIVDMPENQLVDLHSLIQLKIDRQGDGVHVAGEIYVPRSKEPILFERSVKELPGSFNTPVGTITLQRNPGVGAELPEQTMYATIMPLEYAAKAYGSRLSVSASSKTTTVAVLNYLDTQPERAIDYLNELFRSYNEDANEDKNEVALKTEEFLKNRISAIREELDATESNLESYKKKNELINLTNDASNALNKLTEYQKEQVELETQLNLVTALLDYVDDPRNAFNVVPSNLGLKDAVMSNLLCEFRMRHPHLKVVLEPGSAFGWQTGPLVSEVVDIVENHDIKTAVLNVSFTCHMPDCLEMPYWPAVRLADATTQFSAANPEMAATPAETLENEIHAAGPCEYRLGGNSCLSGDWLGSWRFHRPLCVGDKVVFADMNHYTTVKTCTFNGIAHPSIIIERLDGTREVLRKYSYEDYRDRMD